MLIEYWLDRSVPVIVLLLAAALAASALAIRWITFGRLTRSVAASLGGVVAPFFGAVSVLFSLLTGFAATDAWERNRVASRAILAERDGLVAIHDLSLSAAADLSAIRAAVRTYLDVVISDEWPRLPNGESSPKVGPALGALLREIARPGLSTETGEVGEVAQTALLDLALRVRSARSDRLALSEQYSDHPKWWSVFLLAVLTQVALGLVHLDKPRAQAAALVVFSAAAVVAIGLIAVKERPFDGPLGLAPTALAEALARMPPDAPPEPASKP